MLSTKSKVLKYLLLCFVAGVAAASLLFEFQFDLFYLYLIFLFFSFLAAWLWSHPVWRLVFLGLAFVALGLWRYQISLPVISDDKIWYYVNQPVNFSGVIIDEPDVRINQTKLTVSTQQVNGRAVSGKVLLTAGLYPEYQYGDLISVNCRLTRPESFDDFAYDRYLAVKDIYVQCRYPRIELLSSGRGNLFKTQIFALKNRLISLINSNLPEPQASLFAAIILGARRGLPPALSEQFNITGTTHLVAISGLNIAIIINLLTEFFAWLGVGRKKVFYLITVFLIFYITIVGFPASAVRAALMGYLAVLALQVGRTSQATNALILTAAIMIFINPKILRDDVGFQLSFCAILGLIYFSPYLVERWRSYPSFLGVKESLQSTLAAQLSTLPLIIYNFGRLSLIAPAANLFVVPILPYLTILGFIVLPLALLFNFLTPYLFWPIWLMLTYLIKAVAFFASLPLASVTL